MLMMPEENLSQQVSARSETMYAGVSSSQDGRTYLLLLRGTLWVGLLVEDCKMSYVSSVWEDCLRFY